METTDLQAPATTTTTADADAVFLPALLQLVEWAQKIDANLLICARKGTGGTLVYMPGKDTEEGVYVRFNSPKTTPPE